MTLLYHESVTQVNHADRSEYVQVVQGVNEIVAWFDSDPANRVVDEQHNQMIDRILTAYKAAWPKQQCSG